MYALETQINRVYHTGTPLVCITTADPLSAEIPIFNIVSKQNVVASIGDVPLEGDRPVLRWDTTTGLEGLNNNGMAVAEWITKANQPESTPFDNPTMPTLTRPDDFLRAIRAQLPRGCVVMAHNLHRWWDDSVIMQAIQSLRDEFKRNERTLYMLVPPGSMMPTEVQYDVVRLHEPRPTDSELGGIVKQVVNDSGITEPDHEKLIKVISAVRGLPAYSAEQEIAMSIPNMMIGIDVNMLRERQRMVINETAGLSIYAGTETYSSIGGLSQLKWLLHRVLTGRRQIQVIVFIDEIEKKMAGAMSDSSGVSQDAHDVLLRYMQDNDQTGLILVGPSGTGKSLACKAAGNEHDILTVCLDLGATKDPRGLVGRSEYRIRLAMDTIKSLSGGNALFVATSNDVGKLSPELRARFRLGTMFQDLPDKEEKAQIWEVQQVQYPELDFDELPNDQGWSGRDIWNCADKAWDMRLTLAEAAEQVVPISISAADRINSLRLEAKNRYLSASYPGPYQFPTDEEGGGRKYNIAGGNN